MEMRNLGRSGLKVSVAGLGCNNFGERISAKEAAPVIDAAIDAGITLFDTADFYGGRGGSETVLGELLGPRRQNLVLATKFGLQMDDAGHSKGASRRYILNAVEASLKRLKTDWIDVYFLHTPDPSTPIEETLRALDDIVRAGKVRYIACSNLSPVQLVEAAWAAEKYGTTNFIAAEDHYSLLVRGAEEQAIPLLQKYSMGLLPYFPLAGGLLSGKYSANEAPPADSRFAHWGHIGKMFMNDRNWRAIGKLQAFADERGIDMVTLALGWLAGNPVVSSVIAGATRPDQVLANAKALEWRPGADDRAAIDALLKDA
jgi:aryl-alcohol dehydrogenase-like predicted oxidoreductase